MEKKEKKIKLKVDIQIDPAVTLNRPAKYRYVLKFKSDLEADKLRLFNGFKVGDFETMFNYPDKSLYLVKLGSLLAGEDKSKESFELKTKKIYTAMLEAVDVQKELKVNRPDLDFEYTLILELETEAINIVCAPYDIKGVWLKDLIENSSEEIYKEFLEDELIFKRLQKYCDLKKVKYPKEATKTIELPLHINLKDIKEVVVTKKLANTFYKFLYVKELLKCEPNTAEHQLGMAAYLDQKLCEFLFNSTIDESMDWNDERFIEEYNNQINAAVKRILKNKELQKYIQ